VPHLDLGRRPGRRGSDSWPGDDPQGQVRRERTSRGGGPASAATAKQQAAADLVQGASQGVGGGREQGVHQHAGQAGGHDFLFENSAGGMECFWA